MLWLSEVETACGEHEDVNMEAIIGYVQLSTGMVYMCDLGGSV
jgi:hypothetical protein